MGLELLKDQCPQNRFQVQVGFPAAWHCGVHILLIIYPKVISDILAV